MFKIFRRQYLVEPKFQMSFLGFSLVVAVMVSGIFYIGYHYSFSTLFQTSEMLHNTTPEMAELLKEQMELMGKLFWLALSTSFLGIMILGLQMSNRVAGPIVRLRKHLAEYNEKGVYRPVEFRKNDFFIELAEDINKAIGKNQR
jgi:hypothetical protein